MWPPTWTWSSPPNLEAKEDVAISPNCNKNNDMLEHSEPQGDIKTETDQKSDDTETCFGGTLQTKIRR